MNSSIPLLTVTVLSILSISLQAVYLQTHPNNPSSVVAIVALALMFVTPMAKVYLGAIGEWIFIVTSLVSLGAQGYAFGHGIGKPDGYSIIIFVHSCHSTLRQFLQNNNFFYIFLILRA